MSYAHIYRNKNNKSANVDFLLCSNNSLTNILHQKGSIRMAFGVQRSSCGFASVSMARSLSGCCDMRVRRVRKFVSVSHSLPWGKRTLWIFRRGSQNFRFLFLFIFIVFRTFRVPFRAYVAFWICIQDSQFLALFRMWSQNWRVWKAQPFDSVFYRQHNLYHFNSFLLFFFLENEIV